ncbi:MAG TPA: MBL fold metallo-hydrolase [Candidatus Korarchaeota archaeon]|nr:MBL fold metallo-hydrolase [Candidatus Korarchaeota archaeon]
MSKTWAKEGISAKVMFSVPGVATQILVSSDKEADLLLDCGSGVLRDLLSHYRDSDGFMRIMAVLISHEHFDHVGGLYPLLDFMHMIGRDKPLTILAPRPSIVVKRIIDALLTFRKSSLTYEIELKEVSGGDKMSIVPFEVKAFKVVHRGSTKTEPVGPLIPAVGYSIIYRGVKLVYSGDTGLCESLEQEVIEADLAILEATWKDSKGYEEIHLSERDAIELGKKAREFILIHRLRDLDLFLEG